MAIDIKAPHQDADDKYWIRFKSILKDLSESKRSQIIETLNTRQKERLQETGRAGVVIKRKRDCPDCKTTMEPIQIANRGLEYTKIYADQSWLSGLRRDGGLNQQLCPKCKRIFWYAEPYHEKVKPEDQERMGGLSISESGDSQGGLSLEPEDD